MVADNGGTRNIARTSSTHFSPLQPTWAQDWSSTHLAALLTLSLLLNDSVLIHDTQLLDNPRIAHSFRAQSDPRRGHLYRLVRDSIRGDAIHVAVRESMVLNSVAIPCADLRDVHAGWLRQAAPGVVFVIPRSDGPEITRGIAADIDPILSPTNVERYNYLAVKQRFQANIRASYESRAPGSLHDMVRILPPDVRHSYEKVLERDWFTHSDLFVLVRDLYATRLIAAQGLFDEAAYAAWFGTNLYGIDDPNNVDTPDFLDLARSGDDAMRQQQRELDGYLGKHEEILLEGPSLGLLGSLSFTDILELRQLAPDFTHARRGMAPDFLAPNDVIDAYQNYWREICKYLRERYPTATRRPTRLIVTMRQHAPRLAAALSSSISILHSLVSDLLGAAPYLRNMPATRKGLTRAFSLEFLITTDRDEYKQLRSSLPPITWNVAC